jgi:thiol-disulfide isomerase/thioredoxin
MIFIFYARFKSNLLPLIVISILLQSCIYRIDRVNIEGEFQANPKSYVFISKFEGDSLILIDSVRTNSHGHFNLKLKTENPFFVTIGLNKVHPPIILLIQPGEKLSIQAESFDLSDYKVFGSHGSALIHDLTLQFNKTKSKIDSLKNIYYSNLGNQKIDSIKHLLDSTYYIITTNHWKYSYSFIKENTFSPASILALSQSYDSIHPVFNYIKDRKLFRLIDSSLLSVYSSNSIVRNFHSKIQKMDSLYERNSKRESMFKVGEILPNVGYPLISGENLFISGIWYKYILIDFWGDWCDVCQKNNAQLREIYKEFAPKGLVVVQVSLGANPDSLKSKVARDSMFWYHACLTDMYNSKLLDTLKVSSVPSSYIADRWGNIKAVNCNRESLRSKLKELLPK